MSSEHQQSSIDQGFHSSSILSSGTNSRSQTPGSQTPGSQTPGFQTPGSQTHGSQTHGSQTHGPQTPGSETHGSQTPGSQTPGSQTPGSQTPGSHLIDNKCIEPFSQSSLLQGEVNVGFTPVQTPTGYTAVPIPAGYTPAQTPTFASCDNMEFLTEADHLNEVVTRGRDLSDYKPRSTEFSAENKSAGTVKSFGYIGSNDRQGIYSSLVFIYNRIGNIEKLVIKTK